MQRARGAMEEETDHESLLCTVTEMDSASCSKKQLDRVPCPYVQASKRFRIQERKFKTQYAHLYFCRLNLMRKIVEETAKREWGGLANKQRLRVRIN